MSELMWACQRLALLPALPTATLPRACCGSRASLPAVRCARRPSSPTFSGVEYRVDTELNIVKRNFDALKHVAQAEPVMGAPSTRADTVWSRRKGAAWVGADVDEEAKPQPRAPQPQMRLSSRSDDSRSGSASAADGSGSADGASGSADEPLVVLASSEQAATAPSSLRGLPLVLSQSRRKLVGLASASFASTLLAFLHPQHMGTRDALAEGCDDDCKQRIADRRKLFEQSRTTNDRQKILDLSKQRAAMYNTTFQGASCIPGLPCY